MLIMLIIQVGYESCLLSLLVTFLFLQEEFQEVLDQGGPHGADAVVALQQWEGDGTAGNTVPVQELEDFGSMRPQLIFILGEYVHET